MLQTVLVSLNLKVDGSSVGDIKKVLIKDYGEVGKMGSIKKLKTKSVGPAIFGLQVEKNIKTLRN